MNELDISDLGIYMDQDRILTVHIWTSFVCHNCEAHPVLERHYKNEESKTNI